MGIKCALQEKKIGKPMSGRTQNKHMPRWKPSDNHESILDCRIWTLDEKKQSCPLTQNKIQI